MNFLDNIEQVVAVYPLLAFGAVFLAGEATHETLWGTVDGAWESGERAAEAALRRIGALKDAEPAAAPTRRARPRRRSDG